MYKIGDFSKITGFTIKALRYYDEEALLVPSQILDNGYRLYNEDDFIVAMRIKLLKELHFSVAEMKDVIFNTQSDEELQDYLIEKRNQVEKEIQRKEELIEIMNGYLLQGELKNQLDNQYKMDMKLVKEQLVISYRFQGVYQDMSIYSPKLYKLAKNKASGKIMTLYHDQGYKEQADMEVCLPVKERISGIDVEMKILPEVYTLVTTHIGRYENLRYAYKALLDYATLHQLELLFPSREVYVKGPGMFMKGNPDQYITEIQIPIRKDENYGI